MRRLLISLGLFTCYSVVSIQVFPSLAIAQTSPVRPADLSPALRALLEQALVEYQQNRYPETLVLLQKALAEAQRLADRPGEATVFTSLGHTYSRLGKATEAIAYYRQSLQIRQHSQDRVGEAEQWGFIGQVQDSIRQFSAAIAAFDQALALWRSLGNRAGEAQTLGNLGAVYLNANQPNRAVELMQQALVLHRQLGDWPRVADVLDNLGSAYQRLGQYDRALEFYQQALTLNQETQNRFGEAETLQNIGKIYLSRGEFSLALTQLNASLTVWKQLGNQQREAVVLTDIGTVYSRLGQVDQALTIYQSVLSIHRSVGDWRNESITLNLLGSLLSDFGEYARALEVLQSAYEINRRYNNLSGLGTSLSNTANVYFKLANYSKALKLYQEALVIQEKLGDQQAIATLYNNIGVTYDALRQFFQALEFYQKAMKLHESLGNRANMATVFNNIGEIHRRLNQPQQALNYYDQSLKIRQEIGDRPGQAESFNNIGAAYDGLKQYDRAVAIYRQAVALTREMRDRPLESTALSNLGFAQFRNGQFAEASQTLYQAVQVLESLRLGLGDLDKVSLFDSRLDSYRILQQSLAAQNQVEAALEVAERGRARAFVELVARRMTRVTDNPAAKLAAVPPPNIAEIRQIAQIQQATLVQYSVVDAQELLIWVIQPNGQITLRRASSQVFERLRGSIDDVVTRGRDSMGLQRGLMFMEAATATSRTDQPTRPEIWINPQLQQLYQVLIQPIADLLPTDPKARVILIPQDRLFLVPFPALQNAQGEYLIQRHTLLIAPSIQILQLTHQQRQQRPLNLQLSSEEFLLVGNPTMPKVPIAPGQPPQQLSALPGSEQEARSIGALANVKPLLGAQATKQTVLKRMESAQIIHLATHGLLDDFEGLDVPGAIALAPDAPSLSSSRFNGLLTAGEILNLRLQASLVVLSACDTGGGRITGDGVIGLSRSFIAAGVPSVVVSLWKVSDEATAALMQEFYRQLQRSETLDKAQALRQAMLTTMQQYPDPADWAAFTLVGEAL